MPCTCKGEGLTSTRVLGEGVSSTRVLRLVHGVMAAACL
jgi:hypothetical protein